MVVSPRHYIIGSRPFAFRSAKRKQQNPRETPGPPNLPFAMIEIFPMCPKVSDFLLLRSLSLVVIRTVSWVLFSLCLSSLSPCLSLCLSPRLSVHSVLSTSGAYYLRLADKKAKPREANHSRSRFQIWQGLQSSCSWLLCPHCFDVAGVCTNNYNSSN